MSFSVHFRKKDIDLELRGSESFVMRQLRLLSPYLGEVDGGALAANKDSGRRLVGPSAEGPEAGSTGAEPRDDLIEFFRSIAPQGDSQIDAALLFSYYLQNRLGRDSLGVGDLIRCCIRAGVDTRNFNRALGTLTRRGLLKTVREGRAYTLSRRGSAAVESRIPETR